MFVSDIFNKEDLSTVIINELKLLGVKYRKEKKSKFVQEKCGRKRIFHVHLHQLELTDVLLTNGAVVQIPSFVSTACQRISEQIETEGLFRKTGSHLRQKEIKINLENGLPLGKNYHVIDVANVLKAFFRELPDPLIPAHLQEILLRGYLLAEGKLKAMLLGCLLLPPLTLSTLTFFMQFLNKVSTFSEQNKMTISNLAIIFTPGLMPSNDINSIRFNNHVKIVQLLIQNADSIGILPNDVASKLAVNITPMKPVLEQSSILNFTDKKKKKRRSGSLNRMFNGIKKIVGAISSSPENLENTPENTMINTPCITKSNKKRKMVEAVSGFSTKKKKDFLNLFPDGNILPNTPMYMKETKKSRISVGGRKHMKHMPSMDSQPLLSSIERRWSVVGSAWTRKKNNDLSKKENLKILSPVISLPNIPSLDFPKLVLEEQDNSNDTKSNHSVNTQSLSDDNNSADSIDYVRVPKCEYEAIKERVKSIEKRISQEFDLVQNSLKLSEMEINSIPCKISYEKEMTGPEKVLTKFEKTIEETENIISPSTDQLAKRLSRDLKIRHSSEQRVIRSPSARKIGSIRRRSREKVRLSRNATWHISSTSAKTQDMPSSGISFYPKVATNLKRGRPNTVTTGLHTPITISNVHTTEDAKQEGKLNDFPVQSQNRILNIEICQEKQNNSELTSTTLETMPTKSKVVEEWVDGAVFFDNDILMQTPNNKNDSDIFTTPNNRSFRKKSVTPNFTTPLAKMKAENKTPMLPPKSVPKRGTKTPGLNLRPSSQKKNIDISNKMNPFSPLVEENPSGRASIARLRALNAGMVLAKAKLFNDMDHNQAHLNVHSNNTPMVENHRQSSHMVKKYEDSTNFKNVKLSRITEKINVVESSPLQNKTPRRKNNSKSPGYIQKRPKLLMTKYPDKNTLTAIIKEQAPANTSIFAEGIKNTLLKNVEKSTIRCSPRKSTTPRIKKNLTKYSSPKKHNKYSKITERSVVGNNRTPVRANNTICLRQSPRLQQQNMKNRNT